MIEFNTYICYGYLHEGDETTLVHQAEYSSEEDARWELADLESEAPRGTSYRLETVSHWVALGDVLEAGQQYAMIECLVDGERYSLYTPRTEDGGVCVSPAVSPGADEALERAVREELPRINDECAALLAEAA
jgi:hypothetical protein